MKEIIQFDPENQSFYHSTPYWSFECDLKNTDDFGGCFDNLLANGDVISLLYDQGVLIGNDVTVGHNAIIHGCTISDGALIGMAAIIMNGAKIGKGAVVGAGAVVKENMVVDDYQLVVGVPAKIVKTLTSSTYDANVKWAKKYVQLASIHKNCN